MPYGGPTKRDHRNDHVERGEDKRNEPVNGSAVDGLADHEQNQRVGKVNNIYLRVQHRYKSP